jgi:putative oxidoreductase
MVQNTGSSFYVIVERVQALWVRLCDWLGRMASVGDLALRLWIANDFFASALTKIQSFDTTIMLFTYEYEVPLLSPVVAAYLGTGLELILPVLLALGLFGRVSAFILFFFNIVAAISYPELSDAGVRDHQIWGLMLLLLIFRGPGTLSLDHLFFTRLGLFRKHSVS